MTKSTLRVCYLISFHVRLEKSNDSVSTGGRTRYVDPLVIAGEKSVGRCRIGNQEGTLSFPMSRRNVSRPTSPRLDSRLRKAVSAGLTTGPHAGRNARRLIVTIISSIPMISPISRSPAMLIDSSAGFARAAHRLMR